MKDGTTVGHIDLDTDERFVRLRELLGFTTFGLNVMLLQPGQRGRIHRHERQEEVYLVLEGVMTVTVEDEGAGSSAGAGAGAGAADVTGAGTTQDHTLAPWDALRVAPGLRRRLANRGRERVVLLAVGGSQPHDGRDGVAYETWDAEEGRSPRDLPLPPDLPSSALE